MNVPTTARASVVEPCPWSDSPNLPFIDCWNDIIAPKVAEFDYLFTEGAAAHGRAALQRAPLCRGERVLDIGCGFGDASLDIASIVGPEGHVLGVDVCRAFVEVGRGIAARRGLTQVDFLLADAQTHRFDPEFDVVYSRFGTMFFGNVVAAMRNIRGSLAPGGRLLATAWRSIDDNPWLSHAKALARDIMPPLPPQPQTCGPGPFSWSSPSLVRGVLQAAGFTDVRLTCITTPLLVGRTLEEAVAMQLAMGPAGELVREAGEAGQALLPRLEERLSDELRRYEGDDGIRMASSSWCIEAYAG